MVGGNVFKWKVVCLTLAGLIWFGGLSPAEEYSFTKALADGAQAEAQGNVAVAVAIYDHAERVELDHASNLCVLARRYCDLAYLTNSTPRQQDLIKRGLACSLRAVKVDARSASAHACVAVCYAKSCSLVDIKTQLAYSQLFRHEAEEAIALDAKQDIAYYLLGRWNLAMAKVGLWSRAYVKLVYGGLPRASNQDAIANFKQAIALAPNRIIHHAGLAMAYEAAGERTLAMTELKQCQLLKPLDRADEKAQREARNRLSFLSR